MKPNAWVVCSAIALAGCSSIPEKTNQPLTSSAEPRYTVSEKMSTLPDNTVVLLSFSGGGTRAAAFSYGVMKGLRDYRYEYQGQTHRLLDQVNAISSVSGGSFTSAYYGLYGEAIFDDFEQAFLYKDVTTSLKDIVMSPEYWFSKHARSAAAADYYNAHIFQDTTFSALRDDGPMIIINATDLSTGARFSFTQEYFDLICSDLNRYSISDAVTASSAVPLLFSPVLLENYPGCERAVYSAQSRHRTLHSATNRSLKKFEDRERYQYLHLVDGGISDNLGLHALYDLVTTQDFGLVAEKDRLQTVVVISVDAAVRPDWEIGHQKQEPTMANLLGSASDVQIHRYNDLSKTYLSMILDEWQAQQPDRRYLFVDINLSTAEDQAFVQSIPTDFHLKEAQVTRLIEHGYQQVMTHPELAHFIYQGTHPQEANRE